MNDVSRRILLIVIIILHFLWAVTCMGQRYHGDEPVFTEAAKGVLESGRPIFDYSAIKPNFQGLWHIPTYVYILSGVIYTFGENIYAIRSVSLIFNVLTILLVYFIVREMKHEDKNKDFWALFAAGIYAFNPLAVQSSVVIDIDGGLLNFFTFLFLYFFAKGKGTPYFIASLVLVFLAKESSAVIIFASFSALALFTLNLKKFIKFLGIFAVSGAISWILFLGLSLLLNLDFMMPLNHNFSSFFSGGAGLVGGGGVALARAVWSLKTFAYYSTPFFCILFLATSLKFYRDILKNKEINRKLLLFNLFSFISILLFFYTGASAWGFPKYYVIAIPAMSIFIALELSKIEWGFFERKKKIFMGLLVASLILMAYLALFIRNPLMPEISTTASMTSLRVAAESIGKTFFLYAIAPMILVFSFSFIFIKKKRFIFSLLFLTAFFYAYINTVNSFSDYSTYYNYGDSGIEEVLQFLEEENISAENVATYPHIGGYIGFSDYYEIIFLYDSHDLFQKNIIDSPEDMYLIIYPRDSHKLGKEVMGNFSLLKQYGSYDIYLKQRDSKKYINQA